MKRALIVASLVGLASCRGRPRSWDAPVDGERVTSGGAAVIELDLASGAPETTPKGLLRVPSRHTFDALVAALHQASTRKELKGVFVSFGVASIGWARAHELGDALALLQKKVPVLCHADAWDNATYAAAARGCGTIALSPGGEVEATGPSAVTPYGRELLVDKLKAQVDILQVGKFKGAAEPLTRDGPSEEFRQSIEGALAAVTKGYREALAVRSVQALVGEGPFVAEEARDKKLVDLIADRKGSREELKKRVGKVPLQVVFGPSADAGERPGLGDVLRLLSAPGGESTARPHVRLLRLHGEIVLGEGGNGLLGGPAGIVSRRVVDRAHALLEDARVKAVVLRIDSPGGSALGSDLAWIALKELRDKKPVIVSIGEMAASGGYYLSCAGTRIFAEPESIVGSIGVVGGKISFGGTLAMAGIHTAAFGDQRAAKMASITEPWDEPTRTRLLETMTSIYDLFLRRISEGRGKPKSAFETAAEGRVFGGERAKELGLVDEIGGLGAALADAKKRAGLEENAPVVVDDASSFFELLSGEDEPVAAALGPLATPEALALVRWLRAVSRATSEGVPRNVATILPLPLLVR